MESVKHSETLSLSYVVVRTRSISPSIYLKIVPSNSVITLTADVSQAICEFADRHPDKSERTLVLIGRAGALYPFFRTSALLKHLDGRTRNIPVVLLYPGERRQDNLLSFMSI
jgi:hypothetical protein